MRFHAHHLRRRIAGLLAKPMFAVSLVFLFCQAVLVVLWADVPMLIDGALDEVQENSVQARQLRRSLAVSPLQNTVQDATLLAMIVIWPVVIAESVFHWFTRPWDAAMRKYHLFGLLFCICPSLRMCARSPELGERLWLPGMGWRRANRHLRIRLERLFSVPMILIALLIMPVLLVEFFLKNQVTQHAWLRVSLHVSTGLIWFAFAAEFILMVSVAEKKLTYCRKHWLDLAIILLPFISFMRSIRVLRASRAVSWLRVSQLSKMARMYRLRGTAMRALRALILLDLFQRLIGGPEKAIERLQRRLDELESESIHLRRKIARLQRELSEHQPPSEPAEDCTASDELSERETLAASETAGNL